MWSKGHKTDLNYYDVSTSETFPDHTLLHQGFAKYSMTLLNLRLEDSGNYICKGKQGIYEFNSSAVLYVAGRTL